MFKMFAVSHLIHFFSKERMTEGGNVNEELEKRKKESGTHPEKVIKV